MVAYVFAACLIISMIMVIILVSRNYSNIDIYYCSLVLMVPVVLLGYWLGVTSASVAEARLAYCVIYLDSTIMPVILLFSLFKSLRINVKRWIKTAAYSIAVLHLAMIWMCRNNDLYYADVVITRTDWGTVFHTASGPLKIIHYIYLAVLLAVMISVLVYCAVKMEKYSRRTIMIYSSFGTVAILIYLLETVFRTDFSVLPILYTAIDIYIALDYEYVHSHDIDCILIDQQKDYSKRGYIAFDKKKRLLSYNDIALQFWPEISELRIDEEISVTDEEKLEQDNVKNLISMLLSVYLFEGESLDEFTRDGITYRATVMDFFLRRKGKPAGIIIEIQDVTAEHAYTQLIKEYGKSLKTEVESQTSRIKTIQNKVVLGMATIIENRDMNTGGHVRRTSDIIGIIVKEMQKQGRSDIDDKFADEVIRSAPMHDLGKISIDNKILCKPAKLTDEEYAIMKTHSAKSGEIVNAILSGVEDPHFVNTAFCLARFHHERWDGKGYPEGLMEDEIPLEARIMAVADVYDALVSKRCYKEPMSFEKAAEIMNEGMGTQFDPAMQPIFAGCREQLEEYYTMAVTNDQEKR